MFQRKQTIAVIAASGLALTYLVLPQATLADAGAISIKAYFNRGEIQAKTQLEEGTGIGGTGGRHYPGSAIRAVELNANRS